VGGGFLLRDLWDYLTQDEKVIMENYIDLVNAWLAGYRPIDEANSNWDHMKKHLENPNCAIKCSLVAAGNGIFKRFDIASKGDIYSIRIVGNCLHGCEWEVRLSLPKPFSPTTKAWIGTAFHTGPCLKG